MNKFWFANVVVVEENLVWVVVKVRWPISNWNKWYNYDIYVRSWNWCKNFPEEDIKRFIYDKELSEEDLEFYE